MNQSSTEKKLLFGQHSSAKNLASVPKQQSPPHVNAPDIPIALQKQLEMLSKRSNSPLRDLNLETINMLKNSGFLGIIFI